RSLVDPLRPVRPWAAGPDVARAARISYRPMYRLDTSSRQDDRWRRSAGAGVRHPRPAPRAPDARLRAAETAQRGARDVPGVLVRLSVPGAAATQAAGL